MTNTEWKELALEHEEEIKEAMQEAFKDSIGDIKDSWSYAVVLDDEGNVRTCFLGQNNTPMDVWEGSAIVVGRWERDSIDECGWDLKDWLTDAEREAYLAWKEENEDTTNPWGDYIEEWNEEVYDRIKLERREDFIDNFMSECVDESWGNFFIDINEQKGGFIW